MPFAKFWAEQTASNVWIAELEVGFPISRFESLRAETYEDIMAKVDEAYRRLTGPSEKEKRKALEAAVPMATAPLSEIVEIVRGEEFSFMPEEPSAEPADAPNSPEAPEAAEIGTRHQAAAVEAPVRQKRQYRKRGSAAS